MNDIPFTRGVLAQEALRLLAHELNSLAVELFSEAGPFPGAAVLLSNLAKKTVERVSRLVAVAGQLKPPNHVADPIDKKLLAIEDILKQIRTDIVPALNGAGGQTDTQAETVIHEVRARVLTLQNQAEKCLEDSTHGLAAGGDPGGQGADGPVRKVIVELDLAGYGDISKFLEQAIGANAVAELNRQIQSSFAESVKEIGAKVEEAILVTIGDGAILAFDHSEQAHRFAESVHHRAQQYNLQIVPQAQRHFRIGISVGNIVLRPNRTVSGELAGYTMAGTAIADAVRLEAACQTGEVLISANAWADLPAGTMRNVYGNEELVAGKRGEMIRAHRRQVVPPGK